MLVQLNFLYCRKKSEAYGTWNGHLFCRESIQVLADIDNRYTVEICTFQKSSSLDSSLPYHFNESLHCLSLESTRWGVWEVSSVEISFLKEVCPIVPFTFVYFVCSIDDGPNDDNGTFNMSASMDKINFVLVPVVPTWYRNYALYIGGAFHLFFSIWMVLEYLIRNWQRIRFYYFSVFMWAPSLL